MAQMAHPDIKQLEAFGLGKLLPEEVETIAEHIARCPVCCQVLEKVKFDSLVDLLRCENEASETRIEAPDVMSDKAALVRNRQGPSIPQELQNHSRYRILGLLGEGGMGVVFKAEHRLMERVVALKVINRQYTANSVVVERFRREVKAATVLTHPNIVSASDAEQAGNLHFLVMEFFESIGIFCRKTHSVIHFAPDRSLVSRLWASSGSSSEKRNRRCCGFHRTGTVSTSPFQRKWGKTGSTRHRF